MSKNSNFSENEDDPEVFESSGEDWKEDEEEKNRRTSKRLSKKPRVQVVESESSEEEDDDEEDSEEDDEEPMKKKMKKNGFKQGKVSESNSNVSNEDANSEDSNSAADAKSTTAMPSSRGLHRKFIPKTIFSEDYATGSFVILKKDAQVGDPSKHPCIWRIDGKALLQKYEAFDQDDKVRHRNTSIYTGWSPMDKDLYAPITVDVIHHSNQNLTVELRWEQLKEINVDSE